MIVGTGCYKDNYIAMYMCQGKGYGSYMKFIYSIRKRVTNCIRIKSQLSGVKTWIFFLYSFIKVAEHILN